MILLFAGLGPEFGLAVGIGDALLLGHLLDQGRAPREALQHIRRNPRNLEIVPFPLNAEAQVLKPVRQPHAECRLEVRGIPFEFAELAGFPAAFFLVPGRIERKDMGVQLRVGEAVHRPGSGMDEFRPDHVAGGAVGVLAASCGRGFSSPLRFAHRLIDRAAERIQDALVAAHGVEQRNRLRHQNVKS